MVNPGDHCEPNQTQQKMKGASMPGKTNPGQKDDNDEEFTQTTPHEREDERSATRKNDVNQSGKTSGGDQNRNRDNQNNRNNPSEKNNTQRQ